MKYNINDLQQKYELELDKVIAKIKSSKAKTVLIQLPDGLKPWSPAISDFLESKTSAHISIWFGDCFGACDIPSTDADLVIQFGHAPWK